MTALAAIHAGRRQLGLEEDDYRDLLERLTGKRSAGAMTPPEQRRVIDEFRRLGFGRARRRLEGKYAAKLQALWIAAWNLGVVANRDDRAMLAFVKRQTGLDHTRFLVYGDDAAKAIEALKAWMEREAGVDWSGTTLEPGYRIASAQFALLRRSDAGFGFASLSEWLMRTGRQPAAQQDTAGWIGAMNSLGALVRAAKK